MFINFPTKPLIGTLFVIVVALFVFNQYGFENRLKRDDAIYIYSGQQMVQGISPYLSVFDHKGPLAPMISAIGILVADFLDIDHIMGVRIVFLLISVLCVAALYLLALTLFKSHTIGFLTALTFINFDGFARHAISGPRAKTPMVLFEILALLLTVKKKWFFASFCGSLAALTWQPCTIYPVITIIFAVVQSSNAERLKNGFYAMVGAAIPLVLVSLYFFYKQSFGEFIDGAIWFNIQHLDRGDITILDNCISLVNSVFKGYSEMAVPIFIGLATIVVIFMWRIKLFENSINNWFRYDHFAIVLVSFPIPFFWSMLDFQSYPDFYVFLPYAALGFGWLLYLSLEGLTNIEKVTPTVRKTLLISICASLIIVPAWHYDRKSSDFLNSQRAWAKQLIEEYGNDVKLMSIDLPETMVLLHRTNPNPYLFIMNGVDNKINADTPGGFDGWLRQIETYSIDVIVAGRQIKGKFVPKLFAWLKKRYNKRMVGDWTIYVKK